MNNPLTAIPALYRKYIYLVLFVAGVVVGAIQVFYAATGDPQPDWILGALAVLAYLGTALGLTAGLNVSSVDTPKPAPAKKGINLDEAGEYSVGYILVVGLVVLMIVYLLTLLL